MSYQPDQYAMKANYAELSLQERSLRERIQNQLRDAQERAKRCEEILALLEKNPETERLITLLGMSGVY
jgi:hypothetical protein